MLKHYLQICSLFCGALLFGQVQTLESAMPVGGNEVGKVPVKESVPAWDKEKKVLHLPEVMPGSSYSNQDGIIGNRGALSMWISPDWNGDADSKNHYLFSLRTNDGKEVMPFWFWAWLRADIPTDTGKASINSRIRKGVVKGDWLHIVLTWNQRYRTSLYLNGELISTRRFTGTEIKNIKSFFIGSNAHGGNVFKGKIKDVRISRKNLSEAKIREMYRARNIFDFAVDRTVYAPGKGKIAFAAAPMGTFSAKVSGQEPDKRASGKMLAVLQDEKGNVLLKKDFGEISVSKLTNFTLGDADLLPGEYYLRFSAENGEKKQSRSYRLYVTQKHTPVNSPDGKAAIGKTPVFSHTFAKFEAGSQKGNNIFCEVFFPAELIGKPCMIEITYPDDRSRCMALYMHTPRSSKSTIRDRLGAGIYTGEEFPVSGKDQVVRYLFEPGFTNYLFEARTLIPDRPAAVKKIAVYPVTAPLPALKINLPEKYPARQIGHMDEDQSFDYNLGWDNMRPKLHNNEVDPVLLRKTIEYFKYTGQDFFTLPLIRYRQTTYSNSSLDEYNGTFPFRQGSIPYWTETLADNGISFVTIINLYAPPRLVDRTGRKSTLPLALTKDGAPLRSSPFDPAQEKASLAEVENFLSRFGRVRGLKGIDLWLEFDVFGFRSLDHGYDDITVAGFTAATGIKVPEFDKNVCQQRYDFLTSPANREKWINYRVKRTTAMITAVRNMIDRYNPDLELYITVSGTLFRGNKQLISTENMDVVKDLRENHCVDLAALQRLPRTWVVPMRIPLLDLWHQHWDKSLSVGCESMWNPKFAKVFRRDDRNFATLYRYYFEHFSKTPMNDKYAGYFQNSDPKPAGRNFLKEYALTLALTDAQRISSGAQPLAALGYEELFREFVRAYRALPARNFTDVPGADDPVTVRFFTAENGTYIYAVNMIGAPVELNIPGVKKLTDLSDMKTLNGRFTLREYELRSFFIAEKTAVKKVEISVDPAYVKRAQDNFRKMETTVKELTADGMKIPDAVTKIAMCRKALDEGKYAEFDRLLWSKSFRRLAGVAAAGKAGYLKQQNLMVKQGHYAVNCGSSEYFRTRSGKLFFPDQPFTAGGSYGYLGGSNVRTIGRNADPIPESNEFKKLFYSEVFRITGYKFTPGKGTYDMTLYLRVGYDPSRKPGIFVVDLQVNGKTVRKKFDIFTNEKDQCVILPIPGIEAVNGEVTLNIYSAKDNSVCMLNAIELKRR